MDHFEKFEKQLLSSYDSTLAVEGTEICKEVDSLFQDNDELLIEKANAYCLFCTDPKRVDIDKKLFERCKKYLKDLRNYRSIKDTLEHVSKTRKNGLKNKILNSI